MDDAGKYIDAKTVQAGSRGEMVMPGTISLIRSSFFRIVALSCCSIMLWPATNSFADSDGTIVFTQRFDGTPTIVNEVDWT